MVKRLGTASAGDEGKRPKGNDEKDDSQSPSPMDDELMRSIQVGLPHAGKTLHSYCGSMLRRNGFTSYPRGHFLNLKTKKHTQPAASVLSLTIP